METKTWQERFDEEFGGEEKHLSDYYVNDIKQFISDLTTQTREETVRENDLLNLTGKNGDTIYHNDCLTGKRYTWKCIKIDNL